MYVYKISNIQPSSCTILESAAIGVPATVRIKSKKPLSKKQVIDKVNKYLMENYNESIDPADFESVQKPVKTTKKTTILEMADDDIDPLGLGIDEAGNQLGHDPRYNKDEDDKNPEPDPFDGHISGPADLSDLDLTDELSVDSAADDESSFENTGTLEELESREREDQMAEEMRTNEVISEINRLNAEITKANRKINNLLNSLLKKGLR